jgi:hypothetical protein
MPALLGLRFSEEVYATIKRILEHPEAWSKIDSKTRRCSGITY